MRLYILCAILFSASSSLRIPNNDYQLELLQVLFRHGDRIPEKFEIYPTDPYEPNEYEEIGYGQPTEKGLRRLQKLGQMLRQRYDSFLGKYRFNKVYSYSTDKDRTKLSLQAVLAGLFPPSSSANNDTIVTQLIPTYYDKSTNNFLDKHYSSARCPRYFEIVNEAIRQPEIKNRYQKFIKLIEHVKNATGVDCGNKQAWKMYNNIRAVRSMGLPNPKWLSEEDYQKLEELNTLDWDVESYYQASRVLNAGSIIKTFLKNIQSNEEKKDDGRKIYLFGGHDFNLAPFIRAHNFTEPPGSPDYGSGIILEKLRRTHDEKVFLRMYYYSGVIDDEVIPLKFGNNGYDIPLEIYQENVASLLPKDDDSCAVVLDATRGKFFR